MAPPTETVQREQTVTGLPTQDEADAWKPEYQPRFKRILFVVTEVSASYGRALNPHLGVAMLMAYLDKHGIENAVIDLQLDYTVDDVVQKAKESKADAIGITMFSFDFVNTYNIIDQIQEKTGLPVILGGAHISTVKGEVLERTKAEYAITRDGEIPLLQLCLGYPLDQIKSLVWKDKGGKIVENQIRKLNWQLDDLPHPAYHKF